MMNKTIEMIAPRLTELMIRKIETLREEWHQPWIADLEHGLPRNLRGTPYRAGNVLMLHFLREIAGFRTPVFLTFRQAQTEGLHVRKGSESFPVYFWKVYIRHRQTRRKIEPAEYYRLSEAQRREYDLLPVIRYYPVFNIDQTDMPEVQPERYAALTAPARVRDYSDGVACPPLDRMLEHRAWLCPIHLRYSECAAYSPTADRIVCPEKRQFPQGAAFYTTLLHEMSHSTGHPARLNRPLGNEYGSAEYAREELVAELTAALCGALLGLSAAPREENAAYLKGWLEKLRAEPTYLFDILVDANKAARMIDEQLERPEEPSDEETLAQAA